MTRYEKNIGVLAKYYPGMDAMVQEAKETLEPELEVLEEASYDGERILKVEKDGRFLYLGGKRSTKEPARIWVDTLGRLQKNAPVVMMGLGNPSYLKELVERTEKRITIIVYEPSLQLFLKFLEMVELERWMEKHLIVFWVEGLEGMGLSHMEGMLKKLLTYEMLAFSRYLVLPNYDVLFAEEAVEFLKLCSQTALAEVLEFNTMKQFSNVMVKNLLLNARYLCSGYKTTQVPEVIPRDIPGILVAAGPSLNKNIEELKKAKGKAFIIAVDTAMKPLLRAGIVPDMFAVIDALKPLDLVQMEAAREIPLLTSLAAASDVLEYHTGMKFFFNEGMQFAERIFLKSKMPFGDVSTGGSVANNVFSFLYKIGINTIILVGQDLAHTGNKAYADGTFREVMEEEDTRHFIMVEGNYEEQVPTKPDLKHFIDWYGMYIEGCQKHQEGFRVINATEGGAKIKNTECMTLREAIEQECSKEINIQECLDQLSPMLDRNTRKWAVDYLCDFPKRFRELKDKAGKAQKLYRKLDKVCGKQNIDRGEYLSILKKLGKQLEEIKKSGAYQLIMITMNNAEFILRSEQFLSEDSLKKEGKEIARKGILYMDHVVKLAEVFSDYAQEVFGEEFLKKFGENAESE